MAPLRILLFTILGLVCSVTSVAQIKIIPRDRLESQANPRLSADSASLHFDTIHIKAERMNEDDSPRVFTFRFRNVGKEVLQIRRLVSTCSCASATCSVSSVSPGEEADISVRYNPKGHPGRFERRVFVYTDDSSSPAAVLRLSVDVENSKDMSGLFPVQMGSIRLRRASVTFESGKIGVEKIPFVNLGNGSIKLRCNRMLMPECLDFRTEPEVIEEGAEGEIIISFDPSRGNVKERMMIMLDGLKLPPSQAAVKVEVK